RVVQCSFLLQLCFQEITQRGEVAAGFLVLALTAPAILVAVALSPSATRARPALVAIAHRQGEPTPLFVGRQHLGLDVVALQEDALGTFARLEGELTHWDERDDAWLDVHEDTELG